MKDTTENMQIPVGASYQIRNDRAAIGGVTASTDLFWRAGATPEEADLLTQGIEVYVREGMAYVQHNISQGPSLTAYSATNIDSAIKRIERAVQGAGYSIPTGWQLDLREAVAERDSEGGHSVTVTREEQREHRAGHGRYVPRSALSGLAVALTAGDTQETVAERCDLHQGQVSRALRGYEGQGISATLRIIEEYASVEVEGPLFYIPDSADEAAQRIKWEACEH